MFVFYFSSLVEVTVKAWLQHNTPGDGRESVFCLWTLKPSRWLLKQLNSGRLALLIVLHPWLDEMMIA